MMASYLFSTGEIIEGDAVELQQALATAYADKQARPQCLCLNPHPPMYMVKLGERFILKRMPNTATQHAADCASYEPPIELSGRAELQGGAIRPDDETGNDRLRLAFSLSHGHSPGAGQSVGGDADSVKADPTRLTLLGLMHYLWDSAGLVRWEPNAPVLRWDAVRQRLLDASLHAAVKHAALKESLYVPEAFDRDHHAGQEARRRALWSRYDRSKTRAYLVCIGELKDFEDARIGRKLIVKHAPGVAFMVDTITAARFGRRYKQMMDAWAADERTRLVVAMTCFIDAGLAHVVEVALMATDHAWIPFDGYREALLTQELQAGRRRFIKTLRYNRPAGSPMAAAVLTDAGPQGVALFLPPSEPDARGSWQELIDHYEGRTWEWAEGDMPALPAAEPTLVDG